MWFRWVLDRRKRSSRFSLHPGTWQMIKISMISLKQLNCYCSPVWLVADAGNVSSTLTFSITSSAVTTQTALEQWDAGTCGQQCLHNKTTAPLAMLKMVVIAKWTAKWSGNNSHMKVSHLAHRSSPKVQYKFKTLALYDETINPTWIITVTR